MSGPEYNVCRLTASLTSSGAGLWRVVAIADLAGPHSFGRVLLQCSVSIAHLLVFGSGMHRCTLIATTFLNCLFDSFFGLCHLGVVKLQQVACRA